MPIGVVSKTRYSGSVTPIEIGAETTIIEVGPEVDDYIVEGYIDLRELASGDELEIREYIAVDGTNYSLFIKHGVSGPVDAPVMRFHAKTLLKHMKYKVTVVQTAGTPRTIYYGFVKEVLGSI